MKAERAHVYLGSEWPEYEDLLIGNRTGLARLRSAIDEALETGVSEIDVGEFIGVRCLDSEFFDKNLGNVNTAGSYIGFALIGIAFVVTIFLVWLVTSQS